MKQYFVKGIEDEPLEYGDVVDVSLIKENDDKTASIKKHVEVPFTPNTKSMLLDLEVIEEKDVEDTKDNKDIENESSVEDVVTGKKDIEGCPLEETVNNIEDSLLEITRILTRHQDILERLSHKVKVLEKEKEPIDIFNQDNSCIIKDPFQPINTLLGVCL